MTEPVAKRASVHMPCLDGLRGLAAMFVVLGHAPDFGLPAVLSPAAKDYGVLIFFVLSGFLMGVLYLGQPFGRAAAVRYVTARVARIVPLYWLVVAASFVYGRLDPGFVFHMTPTQLLRLVTFNGSVSIFWSIGPEFQFYAVFLAIWLLRARMRLPSFLVTMAVVAAAVFMEAPAMPGVFVLSKLHVFGCGLLFALLRQRLPSPPPAAVAIGQAIAVASLALLAGSAAFSEALGDARFNPAADPAFWAFYGSLPRTLLAGAIVWSLSYRGPVVDPIFANRPMRLLGGISFSLYLLHNPVFDLSTRLGLPGLVGAPAALVIAVAVIVLVSMLSFRVIEAPMQRFVKKQVGTGAFKAVQPAE